MVGSIIRIRFAVPGAVVVPVGAKNSLASSAVDFAAFSDIDFVSESAELQQKESSDLFDSSLQLERTAIADDLKLHRNFYVLLVEDADNSTWLLGTNRTPLECRVMDSIITAQVVNRPGTTLQFAGLQAELALLLI